MMQHSKPNWLRPGMGLNLLQIMIVDYTGIQSRQAFGDPVETLNLIPFQGDTSAASQIVDNFDQISLSVIVLAPVLSGP
jgi:hypothetical protein